MIQHILAAHLEAHVHTTDVRVLLGSVWQVNGLL